MATFVSGELGTGEPMAFDTVLVPTDGSKPAEIAAHRAFALAEALDATIHLLSVVDTRLTEHTTARGGKSRVEERLREQASERVASLEETAAAYNVDVVAAIRDGVPATEIVEYTREHDIDSIVMGTYGRGDFERFAVGSVADSVVRTAPVPVMTVPSRPTDEPGRPEPFAHLLVPTDGSEHAEAAARRGLDLAASLGATVHFLTVVDTALERRFPDLFDDEEAQQEHEEARNEWLAQLATTARERGIDTTTTVLSGKPATEIVEYAREHDVDGIVMGTRGRSGIRRFLLGSVATKVIHTSPVPVVTVRAEEET